MQEHPDRQRQAADDEERLDGVRPSGGLLSRLHFLGGRFGLLIVGVVVLSALIYLVVSADGFVRNTELKKEKEKLEAEIEALEDENRVLRQKLERLQTDPGYVEDEARKKLRLIRPGETIYRLSEEPDVSDQRPPVAPPTIP